MTSLHRLQALAFALAMSGLAACADTGAPDLEEGAPGGDAQKGESGAQQGEFADLPIIGGEDVEWQTLAGGHVRLWGWFSVNGEGQLLPFCSATMITDRTAITAAHCLEGSDKTVPPTPVYRGGDFLAQVGDQFAWVTGVSALPLNEDQVRLFLDRDMPVSGRPPVAPDLRVDTQIQCVGRGYTYPNGDYDRFMPQTRAYGHIVSVHEKGFRFVIDSPQDAQVTHGDSGGGCFLDLGGDPNTSPFIGVIRGGSGLNTWYATTLSAFELY